MLLYSCLLGRNEKLRTDASCHFCILFGLFVSLTSVFSIMRMRNWELMLVCLYFVRNPLIEKLRTGAYFMCSCLLRNEILIFLFTLMYFVWLVGMYFFVRIPSEYNCVLLLSCWLFFLIVIPNGYPIPTRNSAAMGMGMNFYPWVCVRTDRNFYS
jgi:hypothetical protein